MQTSARIDRDIVQFANTNFRVERYFSAENEGTVKEGHAQWAQALISFCDLDTQLIPGIDTPAASRQELLRSLVKYAVELGTVPLAEGVETEAEQKACLQLGFQRGQDYLYGKPLAF